MAKLKAAVIGTGSIGFYHLKGYQACARDAEIVALCDVNKKRLAEMAEAFGVAAEHCYTDHQTLLKSEKLDLVSVCTPNVFHYPIAKACVEAGIPTLCEKPMTIDVADAKRLRDLAKAKGVKTMVAFSHRFMACNIAVKKVLDKGTIGKPFMVRVRFAHRGPYPGWAQSDWFYKPELAGGGALVDMGIHAMDLCNLFIGQPVLVTAIMRTLRKPIKVDDNAVIALDFGKDAGCLGYIEVGWTSGPGFGGYEIYGDKGTIINDYVAGPPVVVRGVNRPDGSYEVVREPLKLPENPPEGWTLQMQSWVATVAGKKTKVAIPTAEQGVESVAVAMAAMESSKTGKAVKPKKA